MKIYNKYVLTDDKFLQPSYRISPFRTEDICKNIEIVSSLKEVNSCNSFFGNQNYIFTKSGRDAINIALEKYDLKKEDIVTILTTTGNLYISSCVTRTIEKFCKWSRKVEKNTKLILVNHEFGFPYENLSELLKLGIPIIEDCAHSFISQNEELSVGKVGEYIIYSLPKFFPIQFGGILVCNKNQKINSDLSSNDKVYLEKIINYYISSIEEIINKRRNNYVYLTKELKKINIEPNFEMKDSYCPGVYMFKLTGYDLTELKKFMQNHGVESSIFYDEDVFFIPVNQSLEKEDLDYFIFLIKYFLNKFAVGRDKGDDK